MTRDWKPNVTAIKQSQNLNNLGPTTLFGKLKENEHEITRLKDREESLKKSEKSSIALKVSSSMEAYLVQEDSDSNEDLPNAEEMGMFVRQ
jgi:hypothetical protein